MFTAAVFLCLLGLFGLCTAYNRYAGRTAARYRDGHLWELEPRTTPLSEALGRLIGNAGGLYLSMVLLLTFLGYDPPERIMFGNLELEPLASLAMVLALAQSGATNLYTGLGGGRPGL